MPDPSHPILALVRDLMFASKITATARQLGVSVKTLRDPAKLADEPGDVLLLDLNQDGTIEAAQQWLAAPGRRAIGFVSHMDAEVAARARAAGVQQVMARGAFAAALPELLRNPD